MTVVVTKQFLIPVFIVLMFVATSHDANAVSAITGKAIKCTSISNCSYTINTIKGTGSANTTSTLSFRLPGESKSSTGPYSEYIISQTCCYLYHMGGSFTDTDANNGKVVTGTIDTYVALVPTHCNNHGCIWIAALDNGTITFNPTKQDPTSITVTCNPSNLVPGQSSKCIVKVTDLSLPSSIPTGIVNFSTSSSFATFNHTACTLSSGSCSVIFTAGDEDSGGVTINAAYKGNSNYHTSSGSTSIYVTQPP